MKLPFQRSSASADARTPEASPVELQSKFAAQMKGAHNFLDLIEEGKAARQGGTEASFKSTGDLLGLVAEVKADVGALRQRIARMPEDMRPAAEAELSELQERLASVQSVAFPFPGRPTLSDAPAQLPTTASLPDAAAQRI